MEDRLGQKLVTGASALTGYDVQECTGPLCKGRAFYANGE